MDHELLCPHCRVRYRKAHNLGDKLVCKSCGKAFVAGDVCDQPVGELPDGCAKLQAKADAIDELNAAVDRKAAKAEALAAAEAPEQ